MSDNNISYELQQIQSTLAALTERLAASTATQVGGMQMYIAVGWSPIIALADDGTYYYAQIIDWTGGSGIKPPVLQYLCETGWTYNVAEAARVGIVGGGLPDGDKGDITVASGIWTIDNGVITTIKLADRSVTAAKLFEVGHEKLIGRHSAGAGDAQEIGLDGGLEFQGGNIRREALTGDVTAPAGGNALTITPAANPAWITALAWAKLTGVPATFTPSAHTHPLSDLAQSGATTNQIIQWNGTAWVPVTFTAGIGGTLGTTDNALTRADGTGGATAQGSGVTLDDSANLSATNWTVGSGSYSTRTFSKFCAVGTNIAVVIGPTGTGFISSQTPDGANAGGNLRGDNAVDFSYSRTAATRVASGTGSFNGGIESTASGTNSFSFNGTATGARSIVMGGPAANATATSAIALGPSMTASAQSAFAAGGEGNTASAVYSSAIGGYGNTASGSFAFAFGYYAVASLYGMRAYASGRFAATGDAQVATMVARNTTSNATPTNLFLDGSSARVVVPANSSGVAMISIVARTNTAGDQHMTWRRRVNWERGVAVGTVSIDVETVGTDRGYTGGAWGAGPAWSAAITADTTNGAIDISVTGAAATNIRWVASIEWVETTFA